MIFLNFAFLIITGLFSTDNPQTQSVGREIEFAEYLVQHRFWNDAKFHIDHLLENTAPENHPHLYYLSGWNAYNAGWQRESVNRLQKVEKSHPEYIKSMLFLNYQRSWLAFNGGNSNLNRIAIDHLEKLEISRIVEDELRFTLLAGAALLDRNFHDFERFKNNWQGSDQRIFAHQKRLQDLHRQIEIQRQPSPALAAVFSGILPGSGQIYAGRTGAGISAFLQVAIPAAVTAESYLKSGVFDARTIVFGSFTGLFYVANIYGSYVSVRAANLDFNESINNQILFDIHIPLRTVLIR